MGKRKLRREKKKDSIKAKIRIAILGILFCIAFYVGIGIYKENKVELVEENNIIVERVVEELPITQVIPVEIETVPETYMDYEVIAKLEIPKINLETNVLKDYTADGMKVCSSKFFGPEPNEVGNFCIAGHNYNEENMFNHLINLEKGDELFVTDTKNGTITSSIYDR